MQGVEILTSTKVVTDTAYNWAAYWIGAGCTFVFMELIITSLIYKDATTFKELLLETTVLSIFASLVVSIGCGFINGKPTAYETQHKVTISDEVSMTEFYEHYEVIEQDGRIFTVREKKDE